MSHQTYLTAMGIVTWKARSCLAEPKLNSPLQVFPLLVGPEQPTTGYLMIDSQALQDDNISQLLDKMLQAIGLQRGTAVMMSDLELTNRHWALIMGKDLQCEFKSAQVKIFDHPRELLHNPSKKREAWNNLQYVAKYWVNQ